MEKIKIAINGFGKIGRETFKLLLNMDEIDLVAVNDLTSPSTLAHLLKFDSIRGRFNGDISSTEHTITVNGKEVYIHAEKDPLKLPWGKLGVDIVIESTGIFTDEASAGKHLQAGAKRVIISAPGKGNMKTIVFGVNENTLTGEELIISNASCTTNNAAPMFKVINENFGIENSYFTTIHAYTGDQNLHDGPHRDLRRARAANLSIIPTTTGAAKAVIDVMPELEGKLGGTAMRVPVPVGSITDITCILSKKTTAQEINDVFRKAAEGEMKGIIEFSTDELVSSDIVGNSHSCILDSELTSVNGNMAKIVGWYDNEAGYSGRLAELALLFGKLIKK